MKNGYHKELFNSRVRQFLNLKHGRDSSEKKVEYDEVETILKILYIVLPSVIFLVESLNDISNIIIALMLNVVFSSLKVNSFLKCHIPIPLMSNVVNQFTCLRDANSTYIGKTIRHLVQRVREHTTLPSAIIEHLSICTACKSTHVLNSFKVIDSATSDFEISIKEGLHIKHKNPNLNKQLSTQGMPYMLNIFT